MNHTDKLNHLKEQIERYFDCSLSDAEEATLRRELATTELADPAIDEARALIGFRKPRVSSKRKPAAWISIAASVAVVIFVGAAMLKTEVTPSSSCIARCGKVVVTDESEVIGLFVDDVAAVAPLIEECENEI